MAYYDFIIIGAGASGLMLADAMAKDEFFANKSILLLDKDAKETNDRTWCFWEQGEGQFDKIVSKTWKHIYFGSENLSKRFEIAPYVYKMVKGIDFYTSYLQRIQAAANITFCQEIVIKVTDKGNEVSVITKQNSYTASQVFNSIFDYDMVKHQNKYPVLQQHFLGWFIKTDKPFFDVDQATYMDFSIPQLGNTRFMYVLPFSESEALVEYTLFSKELLPMEKYEEALTSYLTKDLCCPPFQIINSERGSIPMTCYNFHENHSANMHYIGTAGGWAKPSTGYTFMSSAKKVPELINALKSGKALRRLSFKNRFWYYDLLLLDVLAQNNDKGNAVFESLFEKRNPQLIFKFLDEQTDIIEELKFISACPINPFVKALLARLF